MTTVLLIGLYPDAVDYSDPALPKGMNPEKIQAGLDFAMKQMAERGWQADLCLIQPDATAIAAVERQLGSTTYDCIVIGAGVRQPGHTLVLFENLLNAIHKAAPSSALAFNTKAEDSADAAARWVSAPRSIR